jgi:hypothetical protein
MTWFGWLVNPEQQLYPNLVCSLGACGESVADAHHSRFGGLGTKSLCSVLR